MASTPAPTGLRPALGAALATTATLWVVGPLCGVLAGVATAVVTDRLGLGRPGSWDQLGFGLLAAVVGLVAGLIIVALTVARRVGMAWWWGPLVFLGWLASVLWPGAAGTPLIAWLVLWPAGAAALSLPGRRTRGRATLAGVVAVALLGMVGLAPVLRAADGRAKLRADVVSTGVTPLLPQRDDVSLGHGAAAQQHLWYLVSAPDGRSASVWVVADATTQTDTDRSSCKPRQGLACRDVGGGVVHHDTGNPREIRVSRQLPEGWVVLRSTSYNATPFSLAELAQLARDMRPAGVDEFVRRTR